MINKIALIGAGQLGSRHLQGLAQSSFKISIEVVEPFENSRKTAEERYYQIEDRKNISKIDFFTSIDELSSDLELVIVSTASDIRSQIIAELLEKKNVANLVLEKILFQTIEEYYINEDLFKKTNTRCWVNHPRRMFPVYKDLKKELLESTEISYTFQGGDWGLGCNSLHFIDHLSYLSGSNKLTINNSFLDNKLYDSKREGFIEFHGKLIGKLGKHQFSLFSGKEKSPCILTIVSDVLISIIDEVNGKIIISRKKNNWKHEIVNEKIIYFQSELSNLLIEDILIKNRCDLPTYKEAMDLHVPYLECLLNKMEEISGHKHNLCPIT